MTALAPKRSQVAYQHNAGNRAFNWTTHCQRHFGEKLLEMHNVPDSWRNHFRGDAFSDARGHYFTPTPQQVRDKYHELAPILGFRPLPDVARLRRGVTTERDQHRAALQAELDHARTLKHPRVSARLARIEGPTEAWTVPQRIAPSFLFAARRAFPDATFLAPPSRAPTGDRRSVKLSELETALLRALSWLK